jgi:PAS domain S-box-containing protein
LTGPLGNASFGVWIADLRGSFGAVNDRMREICGVPAEGGDRLPELIRIIAPADRRVFLRFLARARRTGDSAVTLTITPDERKSVVVSVRAARIGAGLTLFLVDREQGNEDAGEARAVFQSPRSAICRADRKKVDWISLPLKKMLGQAFVLTPPVPLGSCFSQKTVKLIRQSMDNLEAGEAYPPFQGFLRRPDGTELPVRVSIDPVRAGDGLFLLSVDDVSEFLSKIASLEESNGKYRSITEQVSRPVALLGGLKIVYMNPAMTEIAGGPEGGKARDLTLDQMVSADERVAFAEAFGKFVVSRQVSQSFEATIIRKDAGPLTAKLSIRKIQGVPGAGLMLELEDVTEQRREASRLTGLHEGVERVASILEAATASPDYRRLVQVALERSLEILGWTGGAVYIHDPATKSFRIALSRHIPKKLVEQIADVPAGEGLGGYVAKTLESHILSLDKYPSYLPFGRLFREHGLQWVSLVPLVHNDAATGFIMGLSGTGAPAGESSIGTLTTLGRQLGNALANARNLEAVMKSEDRLHTVVDSLSGIVYTAGPDATILTIDVAVAAVLGYSPRDFDRNRSLFLSLIHEADKKIYLERVTAGSGLGAGFVREYRMRPKAKAAFRWMRDTVSVMRDQQGSIVGFTGILSDVTADREKFDAVLSEHSILRTVQDVLPEGIAVFDDGGICVDWNPVMEKLAGTTRAAAIGRKADAVAPLPPSLGPDGFGNAVAARKPIRLGVISPAAEPAASYEVFLVTVPGRGESAPGFLLRYSDVTARQAELDNLLQSEKILLNVINAMDDVMMITDLNGRVVEVNQAFLKVMRYPRSAAVGQEFPYPWLVERDMSRFLIWISRIREQQWLHDFDVNWLTRAGDELQMSLNTTLIRNSLGEPVAMLNIARDITERVRLGRDVEARTSQLEMINRIVTHANRGEDFAPVFRGAADEIVRLMPAHAVFTVSGEGEGSPGRRRPSLTAGS